VEVHDFGQLVAREFQGVVTYTYEPAQFEDDEA
jgi:hypothetical protein